MKPPIQYFGAKQRIADKIVALMDVPHESYVEPYAGSLSILLAKPEKSLETVNDLDSDLVTFWRVLRDQPEALERLCALTPHSRFELVDARDMSEPMNDLERARRVWVQLTQGRASQLGRSTGWRHYQNPGTGPHRFMDQYLTSYVRRIAPAAERLMHVQIECSPALDVILRYGGDPSAMIYCDPPYVAKTRKNGGYAYEMTDADHRDLAEVLHEVRAHVALSGYRCELYDEMYHDWTRTDLVAYTQQGSRGRSGRNGRTESVWTNFDPPTAPLFEQEDSDG